MFAGSGGAQLPGAPGAMPQTAAFSPRTNGQNYNVVCSFGCTPDGVDPVASLNRRSRRPASSGEIAKCDAIRSTVNA